MSILENFHRAIDPETIQKIIDNPLCNEKCDVLHGGDCNVKFLIQSFYGARAVFKMYLIVHLVPLLLFKLKKLKKE